MVAPIQQPTQSTPARDLDAAIDARAVSKTFRGKVRALQDVSIRVQPGEIFGLLGPNGAGKSTLVKILMTIVRPSHCQGRLLGAPIGSKPALARVGYLPEHLRFPDYLTGAQALDVYAALAGVPRTQRKTRAAELIDLVGMEGWASRRIKSYSKGMKQRMGVAQALMNEPDLVLLDEPTDGVDPTGRRDIREIIREMKRQGRTVFINSHLLSELEMVCDRVAILVKGRVVEQGLVSELSAADSRYAIELANPPTMTPLLHAALKSANASLESTQGAPASQRIIAHTGDPDAVQCIIDALRAQCATIVALRPQRLSLEDLFMRAVEQPGMGGVGAERGKAPKVDGDSA